MSMELGSGQRQMNWGVGRVKGRGCEECWRVGGYGRPSGGVLG